MAHYKDPEYKKKYREAHKEETKLVQAEWYENNKETVKAKVRARDLKIRYGITPDDYNRMFLEQMGKCAICGKHQSEVKKSFSVDHNHKTGQVRKLLCNQCNTAIGLLGEDTNTLRKAVEYLEVYNDTFK